MNKKALGFVIRGMLATETEQTLERFSCMMSMIDHAEDLLCDGIVTNAVVTDTNLLFEYIKSQQPEMTLVEITGATFNRDPIHPQLNVKIKRTVYKKKEGDWQSKHKEEGEFTIPVTETWGYLISLYPDSIVPGVVTEVI